MSSPDDFKEGDDEFYLPLEEGGTLPDFSLPDKPDFQFPARRGSLRAELEVVGPPFGPESRIWITNPGSSSVRILRWNNIFEEEKIWFPPMRSDAVIHEELAISYAPSDLGIPFKAAPGLKGAPGLSTRPLAREHATLHKQYRGVSFSDSFFDIAPGARVSIPFDLHNTDVTWAREAWNIWTLFEPQHLAAGDYYLQLSTMARAFLWDGASEPPTLQRSDIPNMPYWPLKSPRSAVSVQPDGSLVPGFGHLVKPPSDTGATQRVKTRSSHSRTTNSKSFIERTRSL